MAWVLVSAGAKRGRERQLLGVDAHERMQSDLDAPLDRVALLDQPVVTKDGDTDVVGLEVERHAAHARREFNHLLGLDVLEAVDTGDTVSDGCVP